MHFTCRAIRDTLVRQPLALIASPMIGLRNLTGSLTVESPNGEHLYTLDVAQFEEWFPSQGLAARIPRFAFDWKKTRLAVTDVSAADKGTTFRLRGEAGWLVWGEADCSIKIVARLEPVGRQAKCLWRHFDIRTSSYFFDVLRSLKEAVLRGRCQKPLSGMGGPIGQLRMNVLPAG